MKSSLTLNLSNKNKIVLRYKITLVAVGLRKQGLNDLYRRKDSFANLVKVAGENAVYEQAFSGLRDLDLMTRC